MSSWDPRCVCGHFGSQHVDQELDCQVCGPEGCNGFDQDLQDVNAQIEAAQREEDRPEPWSPCWRARRRGAGYALVILLCAVLVGILAFYEAWVGVGLATVAACITCALAVDER